MLSRLEKEEKLVITFSTTLQAMEMEELCKTHHIKGRLIPVPPSIFAGCGLAWCSDKSEESYILEKMSEMNIVYQGIHKCMI